MAMQISKTVFTCADVKKGAFAFPRILPLDNFANLYGKTKGLVQCKCGKSTTSTMVVPTSTNCQHGCQQRSKNLTTGI